MEQINILTESLRGHFTEIVQHESGDSDLTEQSIDLATDEHLQSFRTEYQDKLMQLLPETCDELDFIRSLPIDNCNDLTGDARQGLVAKLLDLNNTGQLSPDASRRSELLHDLNFISRLPDTLASKEFMVDQLVGSYLKGTYAPNPLLRMSIVKSVDELQHAISSSSHWDQITAIDAHLQTYFSRIGF